MENKKKQSQNKPINSYIVKIQIIKINKYLNFTCVVYKNKNNDLDEVLNKITIVDNLKLEYLIKYQVLEYEIIRSYKLCSEKSFLIHDIIQKFHKLICEYKKIKKSIITYY